MNRRVAVRAIIVRDGKLLCVRLNNYAGKTIADITDYWCTPGGGVNPGEALLPALKREIIEELGPEPQIGNLLFIQQFVHKDTEQLEFFFHVLNADDYVDVDVSKASHGAIEIAKVDFIDPKSGENVKPTFLTQVSLENLETLATPQIFDYVTNA